MSALGHQRTLNQRVPGSSPGAPTHNLDHLADLITPFRQFSRRSTVHLENSFCPWWGQICRNMWETVVLLPQPKSAAKGIVIVSGTTVRRQRLQLTDVASSEHCVFGFQR